MIRIESKFMRKENTTEQALRSFDPKIRYKLENLKKVTWCHAE